MTNERLTNKHVLAEGPPNPEIVFVGEAPGAEEDASGKPFIGSAGQLLNRCLNKAGIVRSNCGVGNVFTQKPPRNNLNYYFQDKANTKPTWEGEEHIARCAQWLEKYKASGNPKLVVALGAAAMKVLTGKKRINKWRGSILPCTLVEGLWVYSTFHPSYVNCLMNEPEERLDPIKKKESQNVLPLFLVDLDRIKAWVESGGIVSPQRKFELELSYNDILARLERFANAQYQDHLILSIDIETLPDETGPILW